MGVFHVFKLYKWYQITQRTTKFSLLAPEKTLERKDITDIDSNHRLPFSSTIRVGITFTVIFALVFNQLIFIGNVQPIAFS